MTPTTPNGRALLGHLPAHLSADPIWERTILAIEAEAYERGCVAGMAMEKFAATPAPLDGHQTPGEYHDYRVACVKCGEPGFLHVSWRPETWTDPGSLTAALNEEARK